MLVLSRKKDEKILIFSPDGTLLGSIMVIEIRGDKARVGLDFPRDHQVHRKEVADEIEKEKQLKSE